MHESCAPSNVIAIEPAKHKCWPEDDLRDARGGNQCLLSLFGFRVIVDRHRIDHGRRDIHDIADAIALCCFKKPFSCVYVVPDKFFTMQATNLGVSAPQMSAASELPFPRTRFG